MVRCEPSAQLISQRSGKHACSIICRSSSVDTPNSDMAESPLWINLRLDRPGARHRATGRGTCRCACGYALSIVRGSICTLAEEPERCWVVRAVSNRCDGWCFALQDGARSGHTAELPQLKAFDGLDDFFPRVHHEGTVCHHRLVDRLTAQHQHTGGLQGFKQHIGTVTGQ